MSTQSFRLDITPSGRPASTKCTASQGDVGREITVSLIDGTSAYTIPDGASVVLNEYKPDGNIVTADCEWDGSDVTIVLTEQMTAIAGKCLCELQIAYDDIVIGTENFVLAVEKSPIADGVESESVITSLESYVTAAEAAAESAAESAEAAAESASGSTGSSVTITLASLIPDGAGPHNSIYRGEYLGDALTEDQLDAIEAGTFEGIFVGDYWTIDGVTYRVAGLDYFLGTGDTAFTAHHAVIVPDSCLATDVVYGEDYTAGYTGSTVYTETLPSVLEAVEAAFGADYILTHRDYLVSACTNAMVLTHEWADRQIDLLTERMVYGAAAVGNSSYSGIIYNNLITAVSQLPLFAHNPASIWIRANYWLQDIAAAKAAHVQKYGMAYYGSMSATADVRPYFCIGRAS